MWRHDWFSYEQYQVVHRSYMDRLRDEGVVERDTLSFHESEDAEGELALVVLRGRVICSGEVVIRVDKKLMVKRDSHNRWVVKTRFYQYHAWRRNRAGRGRRDLLRIDNAHRARLHRHIFDSAGVETEVVDFELEQMPSLDEFIREAVELASNPTAPLE